MDTEPNDQPMPLDYAKPERRNRLAKVGIFFGLVAAPVVLSLAMSLLALVAIGRRGSNWGMIGALSTIALLSAFVVWILARGYRGRLSREALIAAAVIGLGLAGLALTTCGTLYVGFNRV